MEPAKTTKGWQKQGNPCVAFYSDLAPPWKTRLVPPFSYPRRSLSEKERSERRAWVAVGRKDESCMAGRWAARTYLGRGWRFVGSLAASLRRFGCARHLRAYGDRLRFLQLGQLVRHLTAGTLARQPHQRVDVAGSLLIPRVGNQHLNLGVVRAALRRGRSRTDRCLRVQMSK